MSSLSIKVTIAGRTYPLTIDREEEEVIRKAAAEINKNIDSLKNNYAVKDIQDLLAMTALQFATKNVENLNSLEYDKLSDAIIRLNQELTVNNPSS
ncbi:MAG: cell division protein ZapA [Crocinitomicaceae bacterium]|nr:cell division protein ZapA [Crocinitomicaceae bacterium]|tara:strand:+ start:507 stop:794 length:288 start_codon:yes stop_codon:yes gene_type:complete